MKEGNSYKISGFGKRISFLQMYPTIMNIKTENFEIGDDKPVFFIADIAANHDGDLQRAKDLIWISAEAGADCAKFQHFAETYSKNMTIL